MAKANLGSLEGVMKADVEGFFSSHMTKLEQQLKQIYLRTFKQKLHSLNVLKPDQINNLAMFFDKAEDGMINLRDISLFYAYKYKPEVEEEVEEVEDLGTSMLNAEDLWKPLKACFAHS